MSSYKVIRQPDRMCGVGRWAIKKYYANLSVCLGWKSDQSKSNTLACLYVWGWEGGQLKSNTLACLYALGGRMGS